MRSKLGFVVWLLGVLAISWTAAEWLVAAFSDWPPEWMFALLPLPPLALLVFATWPVRRWLWARRLAFYLGAISWLWLILSVVYGMFNPAFSLFVLASAGAGLILLSMFAPRRMRRPDGKSAFT